MAGHLFGIAKQACGRAYQAAEHERAHVSYEPLIAIVFAAATAEAFINEIGELASQPIIPGEPEPQQVQDLARLLGQVEDDRPTTLLKYQLAKLALRGTTFDKGANPYQDFAVLLDLRNSLMHLKSDRIDSVRHGEVVVHHPRVISKLQSKNVLAEFEDDKNTVASWVVRVSTPAAAKWSCNATAAIVKDIVESIPPSELERTTNEFYYRYDALKSVL